MGTSCKKIPIRKKIRKKIQEDTFNDPVSTPYGKANSSLRPDSFLKSEVILTNFCTSAARAKFFRMTSDFKKLFTGPGKNYILPYRSSLICYLLNVFLPHRSSFTFYILLIYNLFIMRAFHFCSGVSLYVSYIYMLTSPVMGFYACW